MSTHLSITLILSPSPWLILSFSVALPVPTHPFTLSVQPKGEVSPDIDSPRKQQLLQQQGVAHSRRQGQAQ
jgi:hypothetical protein